MNISTTLKSLVATAVIGAASLFSTGCIKTGLENDYFAPPAYSSIENYQRERRYADYDWSQAIDDFDHDVTMSRPASELTKWHVRTSD